jgi:hypothetical protein
MMAEKGSTERARRRGDEETGDRRPETGDRRQETGDRRPETGDRRQETGDRRPETGEEEKRRTGVFRSVERRRWQNDESKEGEKINYMRERESSEKGKKEAKQGQERVSTYSQQDHGRS